MGVENVCRGKASFRKQKACAWKKTTYADRMHSGRAEQRKGGSLGRECDDFRAYGLFPGFGVVKNFMPPVSPEGVTEK